jgi:hypothetical protein
MKANISLPYSQEISTGQYLEPHESSPHFRACFFQLHLTVNLPTQVSLHVVSSLHVFQLILYEFSIPPMRAIRPFTFHNKGHRFRIDYILCFKKLDIKVTSINVTMGHTWWLPDRCMVSIL